MSGTGKIALPAALRRKLGLQPGQTLILDEGPDGVRLLSLNDVIARAQAIVANAASPCVSMAAELIEERWAEAQRE